MNERDALFLNHVVEAIDEIKNFTSTGVMGSWQTARPKAP